MPTFVTKLIGFILLVQNELDMFTYTLEELGLFNLAIARKSHVVELLYCSIRH
jgi:hypothetical protein